MGCQEVAEIMDVPGAIGQAPGSADVSGSAGKSADVSGSASGSADADERARRYAEILGKQRDVAGSHTHLDKVHLLYLQQYSVWQLKDTDMAMQNRPLNTV